MAVNQHNLIWIDLEMTGLDPEKDHLLEIATIVTDSDLHILAEGPVLAIHQPTAILEDMDEWNQTQHRKSGLFDRVIASLCHESQAEAETLSFLAQYVPAQVSPMCGNSICQDRRFLVRYMPHLAQYFHYRHLDVSTLKILAQRWAPQVAASAKKKTQHLALQDIRDSIQELIHYRQYLLKC